MKKINFDELETWQRPHDLSIDIKWLKDGKVIKEMNFDPPINSDVCKDCIREYGAVIEDSKCKEHCKCGERPHRIYCPLGFDKYFVP